MNQAVCPIRGLTPSREFFALLQSLGFDSYSAYLASPLWRSIRRRVYEAKGRVCLACEINAADDIHHDRYDRDTLMGRTLKHLRPLCRHCHEVVHRDTLWVARRHA